MTFEQFSERVLKEAEARYPDVKASVKEIVKNNGVILHGLVMTPDNNEINVAPTIYLDSYYAELEEGGVYMDSIVDRTIDRIFNQYEKYLPEASQIDTTAIFDKDFIKSNVVMRLVNAEKNSDILSNCPYEDFYDLSIEYRVMVSMTKDNEGISSFRLTNEHMMRADISYDELKESAMTNTKGMLGICVRSLSDIIKDLVGEDELEFMLQQDPMPMYVITNDAKLHGAANILYDDVLSSVAEKIDGDMVVLPSSIHEVICLPLNNDISVEELKELVYSVNSTEVAVEEQLSDNIYLYNAQQHKLSDVETYYKEKEESEQIENDESREVEPEEPTRRMGHHR